MKETKHPWDALFTSATRPSTVAENIPFSGGYTILIHHSVTSASQRAHALSATLDEMVSSSDRNVISKSHVIRRQGEWFGMAGPFLLKRAFVELCLRCDGAVVFVSVMGNSGVVDFKNLGCYDADCGKDYEHVQQKEMKKGINALRQFRQNGAVVDLASNPIGWDDEEQNDSDGFISTATINSLQTIFDTIHVAAERLRNQRAESENVERPVPIIFDSLTPLLALHGVQNVSLLLKNFKQQVPSKQSLSPIIAPILYESIRPSDHRLLEDMADAFLSLSLKDNSRNNDAMASGILDVVRHGGNTLGGKLMRAAAPILIMKAGEGSKHKQTNDIRDNCYWVFDHIDEADEEDGGKSTNHHSTKTTNALDQAKSGQNEKPCPRIFLDNNDPEYEDYDEEDPDDDLDL